MRPDFVLLDLDGTLTSGISGWEWLHRHHGVTNEHNYHAFLRGEIDDDAFTRADIELWLSKGPVHVRDVRAVLEEVPMMPGAEALVSRLHEEDVPVAICSGGIDVHAQHVADRLGIEHVVANGLHADQNGWLTGRALLRVMLRGKDEAAANLIRRMGHTPGRGTAVGNSMFDIGMFQVSGRGIAVAPLDEHVIEAAHHVEHRKDLRHVIEAVLEPVDPATPATPGPEATSTTPA